MIDITKPLELSDGTPVKFDGMHVSSNSQPTWIAVIWKGNICYFNSDGSPHFKWKHEANGRTLRNVKELTMERTGLEHVERMEALLRRIVDARKERIMLAQQDELHIVKEARAIVAELDKGKGDWLLAIELTKSKIDLTPYADPCRHWGVRLAHEAIAKGRELALAEMVISKEPRRLDLPEIDRV